MELACEPYLYHVSSAPRSSSVSGRSSSVSPVSPASSPSPPLLESVFVPMAASAKTSCWGLPCGCCSGWVFCPCSVWFSVSSGSICSCSPVSSLSVLPPEPAGAGAFGFAVSGVAGRLSCLQDGDLLRRGLQDEIVRLGRPHAHERQTDTQQQRADQYAAARLLHPREPFKEFFHVCSPSGKRASPLKKSAFCAAYSYF